MRNIPFLIICVIFVHAYCEHIFREEYKHYQRSGVKIICTNSIPPFIIMLLPFKNRHHRTHFSYFFYIYTIVQYSLFFLLTVLSFFDRMQSLCALIILVDMVISWPLLALIERNKRS